MNGRQDNGDAVRVLVVDDETSVRLSLAAYLEDYDFEVAVAESAEQALELMEGQGFDVAIVDLRLPGMSGDAMIQQAARRFPEMRFLIHTGTQAYHLSEELEALGMKPGHVFLKPQADLDRVVHAIRELTGQPG